LVINSRATNNINKNINNTIRVRLFSGILLSSIAANYIVAR